MIEHQQTWWDNNLGKRFDEFVSWVGSKDATSKVFFRNYVKNKQYKSLIDLGCGNATEFFGYKEEYPELTYLGVDSCKLLYDKNKEAGVPMVLAYASNTQLEDNSADVVFARHVLEHQPDFKLVLNEMIRLASKESIHVFFMPPTQAPTHIGYDPTENLYHNRFNKLEIEEHISNNEKVASYEWLKISSIETALIIQIK